MHDDFKSADAAIGGNFLAHRSSADDKNSFLIAGNGDLIEPDDGLMAIGSGGPYALAAARALLKYTNLDAREIAQESMQIAGKICIYTNENLTVESL